MADDVSLIEKLEVIRRHLDSTCYTEGSNQSAECIEVRAVIDALEREFLLLSDRRYFGYNSQLEGENAQLREMVANIQGGQYMGEVIRARVESARYHKVLEQIARGEGDPEQVAAEALAEERRIEVERGGEHEDSESR